MQLRYDLDDHPPLREFILFGLQWLAISIPGIVIIGNVVAGMYCTDQAAQVIYLQKLSFITGVVLLSQVLVGHRLPLIPGPSTVLLIGMIASVGFDPDAVYTSIMIGGLLLFLTAVSGLFGRLQRLFTVRVVAVVLLLIAVALMPTVVDLLISAGPARLPHSLSFAFLLVLFMFLAQRNLPAVWRSSVIFCAMVVGSLAWFVCFSSPAGRQFPGLPLVSGFFSGFTTRPLIDPGVVISFLFCFLGVSVNDLGSIESVSTLLNPPGMKGRVNRGIAFTGLANVVSGFFGVIGPVNFSLSPGVILSTGCASRMPLVLTGVLLALLSFSPLVLGVVGTVPPVVIASTLIYILAFQIAAGLAVIGHAEKGIRLETGVIVGLSVFVGAGVSFLPVRFLDRFPALLRPILGNGFVVGVLTALILEHLVYRNLRKP
ncbi:MAG: putative purine permease YwdJ [Syntrophorhabdaceae bacterium PtaU1.Bin034]|nr:MAG: putative purine permease YwdJ [Syntrophorhabdaceae bacterium PtaU1.Bin034]